MLAHRNVKHTRKIIVNLNMYLDQCKAQDKDYREP
jgi:hypothetical protein